MRAPSPGGNRLAGWERGLPIPTLTGMDTTYDSGPSSLSVALRPLTTVRGWTAVTHHLLGLPLGIVYFTWLVTGLATGLGLAITSRWISLVPS